MTITNREEIVEQLTEMLMQFDKEANTRYPTDVYLYYDSENQTAELDTFANVGGNSWLNDDHYTIYTDKEHYDGDMWSRYQSVEELAEYAEIPLDELREKVIERLKLDEDEAEDFELDYYEAREFFKANDEYMEKLQAAYEECIDDMRSDYADRAEEILNRFEEEQEFIEAEEKARENW